MIKLGQLFQYLRVWPEIFLVLFALAPLACFHLGKVGRGNPGLFGGLPDGQFPALAQPPEVFAERFKIGTIVCLHKKECKSCDNYCKHNVNIFVYNGIPWVYVLANEKNVKAYSEWSETRILEFEAASSTADGGGDGMVPRLLAA